MIISSFNFFGPSFGEPFGELFIGDAFVVGAPDDSAMFVAASFVDSCSSDEFDSRLKSLSRFKYAKEDFGTVNQLLCHWQKTP